MVSKGEILRLLEQAILCEKKMLGVEHKKMLQKVRDSRLDDKGKNELISIFNRTGITSLKHIRKLNELRSRIGKGDWHDV